MPEEKTERNDEILRLRAQGLSLEAIGDLMEITRERVRQIIRAREERDGRTIQP